MDVLLMMFILTLAGEGAGRVMPFDNMAQCEQARSEFMEGAAKQPIALVAAVCVMPVKVQEL